MALTTAAKPGTNANIKPTIIPHIRGHAVYQLVGNVEVCRITTTQIQRRI